MLIILLSNKERLCVLRKEVKFKQVVRYKVFFSSLLAIGILKLP